MFLALPFCFSAVKIGQLLFNTMQTLKFCEELGFTLHSKLIVVTTLKPWKKKKTNWQNELKSTNWHLQMWLFQPGAVTSFLRHLQGGWWPCKNNRYLGSKLCQISHINKRHSNITPSAPMHYLTFVVSTSLKQLLAVLLPTSPLPCAFLLNMWTWYMFRCARSYGSSPST